MKGVILSKSAWHVNFFVWATGNKPKWNSLCPYFWALVSLILVSPILLVSKAVRFIVASIGWFVAKPIEKIKDVELGNKTSAFLDKTATVSGKVFGFIGKCIMWLYLGGGLIGILWLIIDVFLVHGFVFGITIVLSVVGGLALLFALIWFGLEYFESDTHKMVKGMISAKKEKVCPHIDWVD